jgi:hypothetical protein
MACDLVLLLDLLAEHSLSPGLGDADLAVVSSVASKGGHHDNAQSSDTSSVHQR